MFFQKLDTGNDFINGTNGIEESTSWAGLLDASDDTKMSMIKNIKEIIFNPTEVLEGSENFDGAPTADEAGPQLVTVVLEEPTPEQVALINTLKCASRDGSLTVIFVDRRGKFHANEVSDTPATYSGILISQGTFQGKTPDKGAELGNKFQYMFQFYLPEEWYLKSRVVAPDTGFNANDLAPV